MYLERDNMKNFPTTTTVLIILTICIILCSPLYAQRNHEHTRRVMVTDTFVDNGNMSINEGLTQALWKAKKKALREAGVLENIHTITIVTFDNKGSEYQEIYSEVGQLELEGHISIKDQKNQGPIPVNNLFLYIVTITADVLIDEAEEDLHFNFDTKGFQNIYHSGEKMSFTITPTMDCYLRIFYFGETDNDNTLLYPVKDKLKDLPFKADVPVQFPPEDRKFLYDMIFEYSMEVDDKNNDEKIERGEILIIALKDNIPFTTTNGKITKQEVFSWLSKIKKNEKKVQLQVVHIVKR